MFRQQLDGRGGEQNDSHRFDLPWSLSSQRWWDVAAIQNSTGNSSEHKQPRALELLALILLCEVFDPRKGEVGPESVRLFLNRAI